MALLEIPCDTLHAVSVIGHYPYRVARSNTAAEGLMPSPTTPLATPLKKPAAPSCLVPLTGCTTSPVIPSKIPLPKSFAPSITPS